MTFITKKKMARRTMLKGLGAIAGAAHAGFDDPRALGSGHADSRAWDGFTFRTA